MYNASLSCNSHILCKHVHVFVNLFWYGWQLHVKNVHLLAHLHFPMKSTEVQTLGELRMRGTAN